MVHQKVPFKEGYVSVHCKVLAILLVACIVAMSTDQSKSDRQVDLEYSLIIKNIPKKTSTVLVWVPVPPSNRYQKSILKEVKGVWPYVVLEEGEYGNKYIFIEIRPGSQIMDSSISYTIYYRVSRKAFQVNGDHKPDKRPNLKRYLLPDKLVPITGVIAQEAQSITKGVYFPVDCARMLYNNLIATMKYENAGNGGGQGDALHACITRKGNCTDIHSLFIGETRSLGIPSRFVIGISLPPSKSFGTITGYHCWAEFYSDDKSWIPLDASEAYKFPEKKGDFFGRLDANRIEFTVGRDIRLPKSQTEPLNYSIYPHVEIDGKTYSEVKTTFYYSDVN